VFNRDGKVERSDPRVVVVAQSSECSQALLEQGGSGLDVALLVGGLREHESRIGRSPGIAERQMELQCLRCPTSRRSCITAIEGHDRGAVQGFGASGGWPAIRCEGLLEALSALGQVTFHVPEAPHGASKPQYV